MFNTRWETPSMFGRVHKAASVTSSAYDGARIDSSPWRGSDRPVCRISPRSTLPDNTHRPREQGRPLWRLGALGEGQGRSRRSGPPRSRSAHAASQCTQCARVGVSHPSDSAVSLTAVAKTRSTSST